MRRLLLGLTLLLGVTTLVHAALLTDRWMLVGQGVTATYQAPVTFDVPSAPQTMNWLMATTPKRFTFAGRLTITARVDATSGAWFNYQTEPFNTCVSPATARPYFEVANPGGRHLKRGESTDNFRWWSADVAIHGPEPVDAVSLLPLADTVHVRRNPGTLPSRVADKFC